MLIHHHQHHGVILANKQETQSPIFNTLSLPLLSLPTSADQHIHFQISSWNTRTFSCGSWARCQASPAPASPAVMNIHGQKQNDLLCFLLYSPTPGSQVSLVCKKGLNAWSAQLIMFSPPALLSFPVARCALQKGCL